MGDRANIQFTDTKASSNGEFMPQLRAGPPSINLYGHWAGSDLAVAAHEVLDREATRDRWGDPSYCTRMIVQGVLELLGAKSDDLGYGLWFFPDDNEHPILVIDFGQRRVSFDGGTGWDFEEFCALPTSVVRQMAE